MVYLDREKLEKNPRGFLNFDVESLIFIPSKYNQTASLKMYRPCLILAEAR